MTGSRSNCPTPDPPHAAQPIGVEATGLAESALPRDGQPHIDQGYRRRHRLDRRYHPGLTAAQPHRVLLKPRIINLDHPHSSSPGLTRGSQGALEMAGSSPAMTEKWTRFESAGCRPNPRPAA